MRGPIGAIAPIGVAHFDPQAQRAVGQRLPRPQGRQDLFGIWLSLNDVGDSTSQREVDGKRYCLELLGLERAHVPGQLTKCFEVEPAVGADLLADARNELPHVQPTGRALSFIENGKDQ